MTSTEPTVRSFRLELPDGFIELPSDLDTADISEATAFFARLFNLPPDDENAAAAAACFAAIGISSADDGIAGTAMAMYRSPDDPERALLVLLSNACVPATHAGVDIAIAGLLEIHRHAGAEAVAEVRLPAGPAVVVVTEQQSRATIGDVDVPVVRRAITAWVPDPDGTTIAVVSMSSNNWLDWAHVCGLALDVFDTLSWDR